MSYQDINLEPFPFKEINKRLSNTESSTLDEESEEEEIEINQMED